MLALQATAGNASVARLVSAERANANPSTQRQRAIGSPPGAAAADAGARAPAGPGAVPAPPAALAGDAADSAPPGMVAMYPIWDRKAKQRIMVNAEQYELERQALGRLLRHLVKAIPEDAKTILDDYPFSAVKAMYDDVLDSLNSAGRSYARGDLLKAGIWAKDAMRWVDIESKAHKILLAEGALSYVGKRVSMAVIGIFEGAAETVLGLVDQGAGLVGLKPDLAGWNARQYVKIKDAWSGEMGIDHNLVHDDELGRMGGKVATGLATGKAFSGMGTAGTVITVTQTAAGVQGAVKTVVAMRAQGRAWSEIARDPVAIAQVAGALAGIAGLGSSGLPQFKQFFDDAGLYLTGAQLTSLTVAIGAEQDYNKRLDLISDLLSTAGGAADQYRSQRAGDGPPPGTETAPPVRAGEEGGRAPPETGTASARSGAKVPSEQAAGAPPKSQEPVEILAVKADNEAGGKRAPAETAGPVHKPHGIPEASVGALQKVADQLDIVIKARPLNPAAKEALSRGAVPKMELVKAKTINELDLYLGAPRDGLGMVGLFKPQDPPPNLAPDVLAKVNERKKQRQEEYDNLAGEYRQLEQQGLVRVEGALLKVLDPLAVPGVPGEFKSVAGDIDLFDVTHADGSPLTGAQRDYVINLLRSQGIGVEHGAHAWWESQSPETYSKKADEKIRKEHMDESPLVAFVPGEGPARVWADTPVFRPARESKPGDRITPLRDARAVETAAAPDTSKVNEASEIAQRPAEPGLDEPAIVDPGAGGPAGRGPGDGSGGPGGPQGGDGGGGPAIPGRPSTFPTVEAVRTRLRELMPQPVGGEAVGAAVVLLEDRVGGGVREQRVYAGRSGAEPDVPRSDLTQPGRRVHRAEVEYGPADETGALLTDPVRGTPGVNEGYGPRVEERAQQLLERRLAQDAAEQAARNQRAYEDSGGRARPREPRQRTPQEMEVLLERLRRQAEAEVAQEEQVAGHGGTREHDAEAKLLERVSDELLPGDRGEVHLETNFPTCPACIAMLHQFQGDHPRVRLIVHSPAS
jgi:hypothetical protein